ncbi:hydrogenase maturation nickel metallochaperone HypA [Heliobacillus mobilis]|uniref:Hydrogenase maturation factor HypA n=2 Tax=Heliobacterium mobile TaxID=28064 RepID=A0A6I3SIU1_HELMO|nr:hydrogenase maturation nickel metallochaperone HypA [Heliobacterium mobile]MTV48803.1 hydrogenase maturation nickel metallochaperone HypA [Heliobacterium mobile]
MHEMALMESLVDVLAKEAKKHNIQQVKKVKLIVGQLSHALPDALQFAFSVLRQYPPFSSEAELEIEERETRGRCQSCSAEFAVEDNYLFICPQCGGLAVDIVQGRELQIDYFEGD